MTDVVASSSGDQIQLSNIHWAEMQPSHRFRDPSQLFYEPDGFIFVPHAK
jgi:hypothetical protein